MLLIFILEAVFNFSISELIIKIVTAVIDSTGFVIRWQRPEDMLCHRPMTEKHCRMVMGS